MAKNLMQFQKGLSLAEFQKQYGSEEQCRKAVFQWRWPEGFRCPDCEGERYRVLFNGRYQCNACRHQTSLINDLFQHQVAPPPLVSRGLSHDLKQKCHFGIGAPSTVGGQLQHRLTVKTQAATGHEGAGR